MTDYGLTREFWKITSMLSAHLSQWARETGDHPRRLTLGKELFDRLCAETADSIMRKDENILGMIESFKFPGPTGYVMVDREREPRT